jgi:hypothetical protein
MPPIETQPERNASTPQGNLSTPQRSTTAPQARSLLEKEGWLPANGSVTASALGIALTRLLHTIPTRLPKQATNGIIAISTLLASLDDAQTTEIITNKVNEAIQPNLDKLAEVASLLQATAESLRSGAISNANTLEEFREEAHAINDLLSSSAADLILQADNARNLPAPLSQPPPNPSDQLTSLPTPTPFPSYAEILRASIAPAHEEVLSRSQGRLRQVLVERNTPNDNREDELSERALVEKANIAIDLMGDSVPGRPDNEKLFVGAQKLARGRTLYLMASVAAATWLRQDDVRKSFIDHYGSPVSVRNQGYVTIFEYIPVSFIPESRNSQAAVETVNELGAGAILDARYLKDPAKRNPNQKTAFVQITFRAPHLANKALRQGLIIEGKRVFGHKDIQEARRCLKCQGFANRHVAANCRQVHDTCALCGGMHRTADCPPGDYKKYCANCRQEGHHASDRKCPVFISECEKIKKHCPENKYFYFPIVDDPSSWLLVDPSEEPLPAPPIPAPASRNPNHTQPRWNGGPRNARDRTTAPTLAPPRSQPPHTQELNRPNRNRSRPGTASQATLNQWLLGQTNPSAPSAPTQSSQGAHSQTMASNVHSQPTQVDSSQPIPLPQSSPLIFPSSPPSPAHSPDSQ